MGGWQGSRIDKQATKLASKHPSFDGEKKQGKKRSVVYNSRWVEMKPTLIDLVEFLKNVGIFIFCWQINGHRYSAAEEEEEEEPPAQNPAVHFTILDPHDQEMGAFYVAFETPDLWKDQSVRGAATLERKSNDG